MVYYNEVDKGKAAWLRELIKAGVVANGEVDERDVRDVAPADLVGFVQCHFFAGIGVWSYALRQAGLEDDRPVWTGSCPCQSFSTAGKRKGFADERHLWPFWFWLIKQREPECVFGEQVASSDALAWLDLVSADLEGEGYAIGANDLCAAGFGAPHPRQRFYWVAHARHTKPSGRQHDAGRDERFALHVAPSRGGNGRLAQPTREQRSRPAKGAKPPGRALPTNGGVLGGYWGNAEWIECTDGKVRPVEPGSFPLAHGAPARVLRLCGYGDAIVAEVAKGFIEASMEVLGCQ